MNKKIILLIVILIVFQSYVNFSGIRKILIIFKSNLFLNNN